MLTHSTAFSVICSLRVSKIVFITKVLFNKEASVVKLPRFESTRSNWIQTTQELHRNTFVVLHDLHCTTRYHKREYATEKTNYPHSMLKFAATHEIAHITTIDLSLPDS